MGRKSERTREKESESKADCRVPRNYPMYVCVGGSKRCMCVCVGGSQRCMCVSVGGSKRCMCWGEQLPDVCVGRSKRLEEREKVCVSMCICVRVTPIPLPSDVIEVPNPLRLFVIPPPILPIPPIHPLPSAGASCALPRVKILKTQLVSAFTL